LGKGNGQKTRSDQITEPVSANKKESQLKGKGKWNLGKEEPGREE